MTEAEARARLQRMIAATEEPLLDVADIDDLVVIAKRPDSAGLVPSDPLWTPTWDLNAAAAEGWLWKAGKVSPNYSFGIDASRDMQSDVFTHCMAMHESLTKGSSGSAKVPGMIDDFTPPDQISGGGELATGFFDYPFTSS
jgi:hypothetical protein